MHVLLTNDDGPPSHRSSPYIHSFALALEKAGHTVSICIPDVQRSWISKAHLIGATVTPRYYRPPPLTSEKSIAAGLLEKGDVRYGGEGTIHDEPAGDGEEVEEWVLVDGTPATAVQIGLFHAFSHRTEKRPFDLVISGPNYGRNTTALFALSSGTLGSALEAAVCGYKAIALSFAFWGKSSHDEKLVAAAVRHSVKIVEGLVREWPQQEDVDLYSVNVPLVEGLEGNKVWFTEVLGNKWSGGSVFAPVEEGEETNGVEVSHRAADEQEDAPAEHISKTTDKRARHRQYKWQPRFKDVYKTVEGTQPGNDGWALSESCTSITPLKANFMHAAPQLRHTEFKFNSMDLPIRSKARLVHAQLAYEDAYVQPLIVDAIKTLIPSEYLALTEELTTKRDPQLSEGTKRVQMLQPERLDFEYAMSHPDELLINAYINSSAVVRKHFLSSTIERWMAKHPDSCLKTHFKISEHLEVDYAEFLDDALVECFDLRASMDRNQASAAEHVDTEHLVRKKEWWIVKPSMSDRAAGIRLFSSIVELQNIFDEWEEEMPASDDEEEVDDAESDTKGVNTAHLRHFVLQPYIDNPLLMHDRRKFHIRTYVLCVGRMKVFVYKPLLALFAAKPYEPPGAEADLEAHLTNTCLQTSSSDGQRTETSGSVRLFWDLPLLPDITSNIFDQICSVTGDVFEAAAREMVTYFQPWSNAYEVYGLDYLVDAEGTAWLLEVNAFPDFKQTGEELRGLVAGLFKGVLRRAVGPFVGTDMGHGDEDDGMVLVRDVEMSKR